MLRFFASLLPPVISKPFYGILVDWKPYARSKSCPNISILSWILRFYKLKRTSSFYTASNIVKYGVDDYFGSCVDSEESIQDELTLYGINVVETPVVPAEMHVFYEESSVFICLLNIYQRYFRKSVRHYWP